MAQKLVCSGRATLALRFSVETCTRGGVRHCIGMRSRRGSSDCSTSGNECFPGVLSARMGCRVCTVADLEYRRANKRDVSELREETVLVINGKEGPRGHLRQRSAFL